MPLVQRLSSVFRSRLSRRFATKSSRFGLAVSLGFIVAAVGIMSVGFDRSGSADGLFDLFSGASFFGQPPAPPQPEYALQGQASYARPARRRHVARRSDSEPRRSADNGDGSTRSTRVAGKSMCVRLCDGYAFPVGDYHGSSDRASHEATCHAECPGAETALYVMPSGSDSIGDAVRVGTDHNYSDLPDAFHYSTVLDDTCTCHPASGNRITSLLRDFTLRRGDAVMTRSGFKVFHGAAQFPFKPRDFVALSHTHDIRQADLKTFKAIERASLPAATTLAQKPQPMPAVSDRDDGTKQLEHQASR